MENRERQVDMKEKCKDCIFSTDDPTVCDFGEGKMQKPKALLEAEPFYLSDCPFAIADYYFNKAPDDAKIEMVKTRVDRARKYFLK